MVEAGSQEHVQGKVSFANMNGPWVEMNARGAVKSVYCKDAPMDIYINIQ